MAVTKLGNTKSSFNSINYFEKKAEVKSGLNCDIEIAKEQFKGTRQIWGKNDKVQAHTIMQSFRPGEVTPEQAHKLGVELAQKVAGDRGFEVAIYTHTDKDHIHNHIIINSVNFETGKKYHSNSQTLKNIKKTNDEICKNHGLSIASEKSAEIRYTLAEKEILEKGGDSWKDEIREAINQETTQSKTYAEFKKNLQTNYGITINDNPNRKHITFTHPDNGMKVRGYRLGENYTREGIIRNITKQRESVKYNIIEQDEGVEYGTKEQTTRNSRREGNGIRERPLKDSVGGSQRGKPEVAGRIDTIRKQVDSLTATGRREAAKARERANTTKHRIAERTTPEHTESKYQQHTVNKGPNIGGFER